MHRGHGRGPCTRIWSNASMRPVRRLIVFDIAFVSAAPDDEVLAEAMRASGNVVLAASAFSPTGSGDDGSEVAVGSGRGATLPQGTVVMPVRPLRDAAFAVAHTQVHFDQTDGITRDLPLVVEDRADGRIVPALSLAAIAAESGQPVEPIMRRPSGVQVGTRAIPTDDEYAMRISYAPELDNDGREAAVISAADVLDGTAPPDALRDKVVFIGVTDVSLGDRVLTPVAKAAGLPGVLVQANAYNTIATKTYVTDSSTLEIAMWVLLLTLILTFAVQFLPAWLAGAIAVGTLTVYAFGAYFRADTGTIMNLTYPTIAVALAVPLSGAVRYFMETRQRRRVNAIFSQYVPERVATQLIDEGHVDRVAEGLRVEVTAMFCDLRGFTALSSSLAPTEVNRMLSDFYEYGTRLVLDHDGTVMTYIGDEIFAIFGAPVAQRPERGQRGGMRHEIAGAHRRTRRLAGRAPLPAAALRDRVARRRSRRLPRRFDVATPVHGDRRDGERRGPAVQPGRPRAGRAVGGRTRAGPSRTQRRTTGLEGHEGRLGQLHGLEADLGAHSFGHARPLKGSRPQGVGDAVTRRS